MENLKNIKLQEENCNVTSHLSSDNHQTLLICNAHFANEILSCTCNSKFVLEYEIAKIQMFSGSG